MCPSSLANNPFHEVENKREINSALPFIIVTFGIESFVSKSVNAIFQIEGVSE